MSERINRRKREHSQSVAKEPFALDKYFTTLVQIFGYNYGGGECTQTMMVEVHPDPIAAPDHQPGIYCDPDAPPTDPVVLTVSPSQYELWKQLTPAVLDYHMAGQVRNVLATCWGAKEPHPIGSVGFKVNQLEHLGNRSILTLTCYASAEI